MSKVFAVTPLERYVAFPIYFGGLVGIVTSSLGSSLSTTLEVLYILFTLALVAGHLWRTGVEVRFDCLLHFGVDLVVLEIGKVCMEDGGVKIIALFLLSSVLLLAMLDGVKSYKYDIKGPYGVGIKDTIVIGKTTPQVSIFYPINREEYDSQVEDRSKTPSYMIDGEDVIPGLKRGVLQVQRVSDSKALKYIPTNDSFLDLTCRDIGLFRMRAVLGGKLHKDFVSGHKKLTPVVISHGAAARREQHSILASVLASYGCIVYVPNHTDGSSAMYRDHSNDKPKIHYFNFYDALTGKDLFGKEYEHSEFRLQSLLRRIDDIETVIDYIKNKSIKEFENIDLEKLVAVGHSLGGMTSIEMAKRFDKDFKACVSYDPYFCARHKDISSGSYSITQPLLILNTQGFDERYRPIPSVSNSIPYDQVLVHSEFFKSCPSIPKFDIALPGPQHCSILDDAILKPSVFSMLNLSGDKNKVVAEMDKHADITLSFMHKLDLLPIKPQNIVDLDNF